MNKNEQETFWSLRAKNYNNLIWVSDDAYLNKIIDYCQPKPSDMVLDVGTGSGKVAKALQSYVKHVIGMDISTDMMDYDGWQGMSKICGNILTPIFKNNSFDLITARMVFHHVFPIDEGIKNCYNLLSNGGRLVIAESVPPSDDDDVVKWWADVRKFKETRHTFSLHQLKKLLFDAGFTKISYSYYYQPSKKSSTKKWLEHSKLPQNIQKKIYEAHLSASDKIKKEHKMTITPTDIYCQHRHLIIKGYKNGK